MDRLKPFALPGYLILATMVVFPLLDAVLTVWPLRVGEVSWRFGAVGMFSRALMTPVFALILMYGLALILEHRILQRVISVITGIAAPALALAGVFFVLDALQMRVQVQPQMMNAFDVASVVALAKILITAGISMLVCISAFRSSRPIAGKRARDRAHAAPGLMREPAPRA